MYDTHIAPITRSLQNTIEGLGIWLIPEADSRPKYSQDQVAVALGREK